MYIAQILNIHFYFIIAPISVELAWGIIRMLVLYFAWYLLIIALSSFKFLKTVIVDAGWLDTSFYTFWNILATLEFWISMLI